MFGMMRMLFWIIVSGVCFRVLNKRERMNQKRNKMFLIVIITLLWTSSALVPIENLFISFSTPEKSYGYVNWEEVKVVVYGQESALVIGTDEDYVYLIVPKGKKGWKIGRGIDLKLVSNQYFDGIVVDIYQYKDTAEFYIEVKDIDGEKCEVHDNRNSYFTIFETDVNEGNQYYYYAYVHGLNENYILNVNDRELRLNNQ